MPARSAPDAAPTGPRWYEVRIPRMPGYQKVADSFLADLSRARVEAGLEREEVRHSADGQADRYLVPPAAAALYFECEHPSAIAAWLRSIQLAQPCLADPDAGDTQPAER